jgi:hypothetical protein
MRCARGSIASTHKDKQAHARTITYTYTQEHKHTYMDHAGVSNGSGFTADSRVGEVGLLRHRCLDAEQRLEAEELRCVLACVPCVCSCMCVCVPCVCTCVLCVCERVNCTDLFLSCVV